MKNVLLTFALLAILLAGCKQGATTEKAEATDNGFVRINANTNPDADKVLALYAYGQKVIQSMECTAPASWYYQGSMHSVPARDSIIGRTVNDCPPYNDGKTLTAWNSCPHMYPTFKQLNFLTWHRLYIYYYEKNIRYYIENGWERVPGLGAEMAEQFSLPYWDYTNSGLMPESFRVKGINTSGINLPENPLYQIGRSPTLMRGLPIDYDSKDGIAVNIAPPGTDTIIVKNLCIRTMREALDIQKFLDLSNVSEFSRGLEDRLHNVMHDYIGGAVDSFDANTEIYNRIYQQTKKAFGLMGYIPSAGFDPIFFLHHSNVDRMFAAWEAYFGPITEADMNKYGGKWEEVGNIYKFWDAASSQWIEYGSTQEMLDAVHSVNYTYQELPVPYSTDKELLASQKKVKKSDTPKNLVATNNVFATSVSGDVTSPFSIPVDQAANKASANVQYKLEVDISFGENMLSQLVVFTLPDDMDWNACDLDSDYIHGITGVFGSTHAMHGDMHNHDTDKAFSHSIIVDVTNAVKKLKEGESLQVYVAPVNGKPSKEFFVTELRLYEAN